MLRDQQQWQRPARRPAPARIQQPSTEDSDARTPAGCPVTVTKAPVASSAFECLPQKVTASRDPYWRLDRLSISPRDRRRASPSGEDAPLATNC